MFKTGDGEVLIVMSYYGKGIIELNTGDDDSLIICEEQVRLVKPRIVH